MIQCFPLYSILLSLNQTSVDYFSLDVEHLEIKVLETIPWDKVRIKVYSINMLFILRQKFRLLYLSVAESHALFIAAALVLPTSEIQQLQKVKRLMLIRRAHGREIFFIPGFKFILTFYRLD